ncbi:antibiotic biosynthesis monooxygenase family protein [Cumulibacter soli]|uniref:antibiotic biosynthesis monooxygenase family protein n=1 Tax=Cumulibacter soli TaxID=2546344 RepID=UPI001068C894|nr:antibiotic biosynthesis monooxygenase [Cumulibacter soli]
MNAYDVIRRVGTMQAIIRFDRPDDRGAFIAQGELALGALSRCAGFRGGELARSTDEPQTWVLSTRWLNVGSYRRALSDYDVKVHATPFMYLARDEVTGFEPVLAADDEGVSRIAGDLADDAHGTGIGDFGTRPEPPASWGPR